MATVPFIFQNATTDIPLSNLDANFAAFQATSGAGLVGYSASVSYASGTVGAVLSQQTVSVKSAPFNAAGDGVTDDTAAIQAAINAVQGTTEGLYFPHGTYLVSGTLSITAAIHIFGAGRFATAITWASTTLNVFNVASNNQVYFAEMTLLGPSGSTAGAAITVAGSSTQNTLSIFRDLGFSLGFNSIVFTAAQQWVIDSCDFLAFAGIAVTIQNTFNVDFGDNTIIACYFGSAVSGAECIRHISSGGLRVIDNKINTAAIGYHMLLASGAATSNLIIQGNSFESCSTACIQFNSSGGGATFAVFSIVGNTLDISPICINAPDASSWLSRGLVSSNVMSILSSGGTGVAFNQVSNANIIANYIEGNGGTSNGITVGASSSNLGVGPNFYFNLTNNLVNAGSASNIIENDTAQGTFTATLTGVSGTVTATVEYAIKGYLVQLDIPALTGTSTSTACTITGIPAGLQPANNKSFAVFTEDNGTITVSQATVAGGGGTITLAKGTTPSTTFTNTGTKGLSSPVTMQYLLT